jgi:hypothetical protein
MASAFVVRDFPGLGELINSADAIVILRIDEHLSNIHGPNGFSTHECTIYQSLKGDIPKYNPTANLRPIFRLMDPELDFATPYALGSSHLVFLIKKMQENEPTEYRSLACHGNHVLLSPLGNEKMPEGDTLEEKIRNVIKGAIEYENQQHEKKQAFLKSMLDIPKMQTDTIEQWGVNNDLPEGVIDIRDRLLSKADHQIRTGLLTQFVEKYPQIRKARDFETMISGKSEEGRIGISLRHIHSGKAKTMDEPVPENERFSVLVVIQEPPRMPTQLEMGPIYSNLGLVGQINMTAGDKELEAGLKKLVDDALKLLAEFNDTFNAESANQEEEQKADLPDKDLSFKRPLTLGPKQYLDLDTGRYISVPLSSEIDTESLQEQGVDMYLVFERHGSAPPMGQLRSLGLAFRDAATRLDLQEATAETVNEALTITKRNLKGVQDELAYHGGNQLYAFRTAEGKAGVMTVKWDHEGGPPQCTLRYRLIPEAFIPDDQYPWGDAINGVQCRLRPVQSRWAQNQIPSFILDIRNTSEKEVDFVPLMAAQCQFQWDGQWYGWAEQLHIGMFVRQLKPGQELINAIEIQLTDSWAVPKEGTLVRQLPGIAEYWGQRFEPSAGKHTLRVRFLHGSGIFGGNIAKKLDSFPVSNPIEVIIQSKEEVIKKAPLEGA